MRLLTLMTVLGFSISGFAQNYTEGHSKIYPEYTISSTQQMLHTIKAENQCAAGETRSFSTVELKGTKTYGDTLYAGVSSYGDIALVHNEDGKTMADLYICSRTSSNGKGQVLGNFNIETSSRCILGQITFGDLILDTDHGLNYQVKFAPIDIPGTDRVSSLCQDRNDVEVSDVDRSVKKESWIKRIFKRKSPRVTAE